MNAYYNEIDPYAVQWLKNLIAEGLIVPGDVDDRPIQEVKPDDLKGYTQCHFFAGIAGWSYALRLAGWPDDRPVWTGSCPCQPFSGAGKKQGAADKRHLWPAFFELIAECKPATVFGEQVAGKLGLEWLCAVRLDLEDIGYACGASDLPAASVGAPHKRSRLFWMADSTSTRGCGSSSGWEDKEFGRSSEIDKWVGNSDSKGLQGRKGRSGEDFCEFSPWTGMSFISCRDGKARPVKPRIYPLAHGVPGRVGKLCAYGNAIVPQVGAKFIKSFMEI